MDEVKRRVADIKTICMDRLDSITADGLELRDAFKQLEELMEKEIKKQGKK